MKKYLLLAILLFSASSFATINERAEYRSELVAALNVIDLDLVESGSTNSSWYINKMWLEFTPYFSFKVPGLAGLKVTPNFRVYLKRGLKADEQDYKPSAM